MTWKPVSERSGRSWRTYTNGQKLRYQTMGGADLSFRNDDDQWQAVDMQLRRVQNGQFDGWMATQAGWHYALGRPADKGEDGWVGFGGKRGRHWFQFRLDRFSYVHWPTRTETVIESAAYSRDQVLVDGQAVALAAGDETIHIASEAQWLKVAPGIRLRWRIDGGKLKEDVIIEQSLRDHLPAGIFETPADETYLAMVFQLDLSRVPKVALAGVVQNLNDDLSDADGRMELRDEQEDLLAFMPLDEATVVRGVNEQPLASVPLRKRIIKVGDEYLMIVGLRMDRYQELPAGTLIFDPTVYTTDSSSPGYDDTYNTYDLPDTVRDTTDVLAVNSGTNYRRSIFFRFDLSSIPSGSTISDVELGMTTYLNGSFGSPISFYPVLRDWVSAELTWNHYKTGATWPGGYGGNSPGVDYDDGERLGVLQCPTENFTSFSGSLTGNFAYWESWCGSSPARTNNGMIGLVPDTYAQNLYSSAATNVNYRPVLTIEYDVTAIEPAAADAVVTASTPPVISDVAAGAATFGVLSLPPIPVQTGGNLYVQTKAESLIVLLLMTKGDYWYLTDPTNAAAEHGVQVERRKAYLVPQ